jgi:hypothetical protein
LDKLSKKIHFLPHVISNIFVFDLQKKIFDITAPCAHIIIFALLKYFICKSNAKFSKYQKEIDYINNFN